MKKNYLLPILIICIYFTQNINSQTTAIPDANFEQALIDLGIDTDGIINQSVLTADISSITSLNVSSKNINDLTGIEAFTSLTSLICHSNTLTNVDIINNTALTELNFYNNQLTSLDVSQNTALIKLECWKNELTELDISNNLALEYLDCGENQFTSLDVTANTALTNLSLNLPLYSLLVKKC